MDRNSYKFIPWLIVLPAFFIGIKAFNTINHSNLTSDDLATTTPDLPEKVSVPPSYPIDPEAWSAFKSSTSVLLGPENENYRLAGTFFLMAKTRDGERRRLAIIDDVANNQQFIVSEGQDFQGHEVVRIYHDKLIMRKDARDITLTLSFANPAKSDESLEATTSEEGEYEASPYGKQIGANRWVLQKNTLREYYKELLEDPERIAAIYMSMKPDLVDDKVAGYLIDKEGEGGFFDAVGLSDGDIIRKVNSMDMTSQRRGEYFLSEFIQDRLGAVVIDIERDGKPEKLIYLLR